MSISNNPTQVWPPRTLNRTAANPTRSTTVHHGDEGPRPGSAPWYGLPPVDETAPPGVQITARVRSRQQHAAEYGRRPLPWLDASLLPEADVA